jgi:hypothetical protein
VAHGHYISIFTIDINFKPLNLSIKISSMKGLAAMTPEFPKSSREHFFHALLFEVVAIGICAPVGAWLLGC